MADDCVIEVLNETICTEPLFLRAVTHLLYTGEMYDGHYGVYEGGLRFVYSETLDGNGPRIHRMAVAYRQFPSAPSFKVLARHWQEHIRPWPNVGAEELLSTIEGCAVESQSLMGVAIVHSNIQWDPFNQDPRLPQFQLYVKPSERNKGIGTQLTAACMVPDRAVAAVHTGSAKTILKQFGVHVLGTPTIALDTPTQGTSS